MDEIKQPFEMAGVFSLQWLAADAFDYSVSSG
jgi:hypothetical protein